jgi:hypothetical protein
MNWVCHQDGGFMMLLMWSFKEICTRAQPTFPKTTTKGEALVEFEEILGHMYEKKGLYSSKQ